MKRKKPLTGFEENMQAFAAQATDILLRYRQGEDVEITPIVSNVVYQSYEDSKNAVLASTGVIEVPGTTDPEAARKFKEYFKETQRRAREEKARAEAADAARVKSAWEQTVAAEVARQVKDAVALETAVLQEQIDELWAELRERQ
jgi:hypothetical protein